MIKFALISIVTILMILGIYTYSNQEDENNITTTSISKKKLEIRKTKQVSPPTKKVNDKKNSVRNITLKSPKIISQASRKEIETQGEIGEGLTLESIKNSDVSDEEKDRMLDDLAYYQSKQASITSSFEEVNSNNTELTLQGIKDADVSDEEKDRMLDDLAYYQSLKPVSESSLSEEEILKLIEKDLKSGLIK